MPSRYHRSPFAGAALKLLLSATVILPVGVGCAETPDQELDPCDGATRCPLAGELPLPKLSDYDFFQGELADQLAKDGVVPYSVSSPLWADQAGKGRYIVLPEGGAITFTERDAWEFPEGTIIIKTFFFDHDRRDRAAGARIIETRLLIRENDAWTPITYVWDDAQTEATLLKTGARINVDFIDEAGEAKVEEYIVPNTDQCGNCHELNDVIELLGPISEQMNREIEVDGESVNQITWLAEQGLFASPPPAPEGLHRFAEPMDESADLNARARAYLHANCSHCHRDGGGASKSGLVFLEWEEEPAKVGICKLPAAAGPGAGGHSHDIAPGDPDGSIVVYRMNSLDPDIKMPELPNRVIDVDGVELIREWIAAMPAKSCSSP